MASRRQKGLPQSPRAQMTIWIDVAPRTVRKKAGSPRRSGPGYGRSSNRAREAYRAPDVSRLFGRPTAHRMMESSEHIRKTRPDRVTPHVAVRGRSVDRQHHAQYDVIATLGGGGGMVWCNARDSKLADTSHSVFFPSSGPTMRAQSSASFGGAGRLRDRPSHICTNSRHRLDSRWTGSSSWPSMRAIR